MSVVTACIQQVAALCWVSAAVTDFDISDYQWGRDEKPGTQREDSRLGVFDITSGPEILKRGRESHQSSEQTSTIHLDPLG